MHARSMYFPLGLAAWALAGCNPADLIPDILGSTDTGDTDTTVVTKVNNDQASLIVTQFLPHSGDPAEQTQARAMFVENVQGYANLAQCVGMRDLWCTEELPSNDGEYFEVTPFDDDVVAQLVSRDVGMEIDFGPIVLRRADVDSLGVTFYSKNFEEVKFGTAPLPLTVGGDWDEWTGDTVSAPTPMVITSHDPLVRHAFPSSEPLLLEWEPGGEGEVFLFFRVPNAQYLQKLDDDGSAELDLRQFALQDGEEVDLYLGRWSTADIDVEGHTVNVQVQSNQWLHGEFTALGNRIELDSGLLYDNCAEADGAPFIEAGLYYGDLRPYTDDFEGYQTCLNGPANGPDAVLPLRLQADELLQVEYLQRSDDAVMYLVEGLCDGTPQCVEGVDDKGRGLQEFMGYRNPAGAPLDLWLVLDTVSPNLSDIFELNIGIETAEENPLKSTCTEALDQGPIDNGSYYGVMGTYPNLLDCMELDDYGEIVFEAGATGGDGKVELYILPNQTLTVDVFAPGANPTAYLLYNCALSKSCLTEDPGVVTAAGNTATLVYTNATGVSEHIFLVVDSGVSGPSGAVQDYFLDIEIQ